VRVFLQSLIGALRALVGDALAAAHLGQYLIDALCRHVVALQDLSGSRSIRCDDSQQQMLGGHVLVPHPLSLAAGSVDHVRERLRHISLCSSTADGWPAAQSLVQLLLDALRLYAQFLQYLRHDAVLLLDERQQQVVDVHCSVVPFLGQLLGCQDSLLRFLSQFVYVHSPLNTLLEVCFL